jgi:hypothetical protein
MALLKDLGAEVIGMFLADARLSVAVLVVVAIAALLVESLETHPLVGGAVLVLGTLLVLLAGVRRAAWRERGGSPEA